jgi:hypothetical protein
MNVLKFCVVVPTTVMLLTGLCLREDASAAGKPKPTSATGSPLLAVVALKEQRITIYSAEGKVMQAPVSTGTGGYETPAGVFSILEKRREHYSNLYDDASMPFMQRLTWSGIALHAGALPGRPASHGCIRLPHSFAGQLFDVTRVGMRVVVVPTDVNPVEVRHALLFRPGPVVSEPRVAAAVERAGGGQEPMRLGAAPADAISERTRTWRAIAVEKAADAESATKAAAEAKATAAKAASDSSEAVRQLRKAEAMLANAERRLKAANRSLEEARSDRAKERAEQEQARTVELVAESGRRLEVVKAEAEPKMKAAEAARAEAEAANAVKAAAQEAAKLAEAKLAPVSVFISRKTQRLYVRQAFQPIFDTPVTVRDPDRPIGTTIFTAVQHVNDDTDLRWIALTMFERSSSRTLAATNAEATKGALERISIPIEAVQRINEVASPGASLIVSDEPMHPRETGKGTDFIVVMSGEPQGGLTIRPRAADRDRAAYRDRERPYRRQPTYRPFFWW